MAAGNPHECWAIDLRMSVLAVPGVGPLAPRHRLGPPVAGGAATGSGIGRQEAKRRVVRAQHRAEMPLVEREQIVGAETLGKDDDRGVREPDRRSA